MELLVEVKNESYRVYRITIDEKLSDDLIRLEICKLIKHSKSGEFKDEPIYWEDYTESETIIKPTKINNNLYADLSTHTKLQTKTILWKDLKEGQVFLIGAFKIKDNQKNTKIFNQYFVDPDKDEFRQIDNDVKANTKSLYYKILSKGEKNGKL